MLPMLAKLVAGLVGLLFVVGLVLALCAHSANRRWQGQLAALRAAGEPLTIQDIQALRAPATGEGDTIADVVTRAADEVEAIRGPVPRGVLGMPGGPDIDFFAGIPAGAIGMTRDYVSARRSALTRLGIIEGLRPGRYAISYDGSPADLTRFTDEGPPIRHLTQLLYLDATLRLVDGDTEGAASNIPLLLRILSPEADEPTGMAGLTSAGAVVRATRVLQDVLRVGVLQDETLRRLDAEFADCLASHSVRWALWGDRAGFIAVLEQHHSIGGVAGMVLRLQDGDHPERVMEMFGWLLDAGEDPAELLAAAKRVETELQKQSEWQSLTSWTVIRTPSLVVAHVWGIAEIRAARVVVAVERFRLKEGEFPELLEELVPEYLSEIPTDPFDGLPMKIARTDAGLVVYSVGRDEVDNSGSVVPDEGAREARDQGFRLLDGAERGVVLIDSPKVDVD